MKENIKNIIIGSIMTISIVGTVIYVNYKNNQLETTLLNKYEILEKTNTTNTEKIALIEDNINKQNKIIEELNKQLDKINNNTKEISDIKKQLLEYENYNETLISQIAELKNEIELLSNEEKILILEQNINAINKKIEEKFNNYDYKEEIEKLFSKTEHLELLLPAKFEIDIDHAIKENETYEVDVKIENILNYNRKNITWKIEDETIATIDDNGIVTPLKAGTTKVIAKYDKYESTTILTIEAVQKYPTDIELFIMGGKQNYNIGESETIRVNYIPNEVKYKNGTWTSSNNSVVSIDQNGLFICLSEGESIIKFTTSNNLSETRTIKCIQN